MESVSPSPAQMMAVLSQRLPYLHRCAYRLLGNEADAEDAAQDALLAAFKQLNQFRGEARLSTWLTAISQLRRNATAQTVAPHPYIPRITDRRRAGAPSLRHSSGRPTESRRGVPQVCAECEADESSSTTNTDAAEDVSPPVCASSFGRRNSSRSGSSHRNRESANSSGAR
jgi:DNA-directed RNA polymerase specialized sigma24 family protein